MSVGHSTGHAQFIDAGKKGNFTAEEKADAKRRISGAVGDAHMHWPQK
jgi:hypothetical protein